jgi:phosphoglycerate dehydrogenase-like enzyme
MDAVAARDARDGAPMTVLVPDDTGVRALRGVRELHAVRYDPAAPEPPSDGRGAQAAVVVRDDLDATLALLGRLPDLRLVQTLSTGTEAWDGRLPPGVALSNARGAHGGSTAEWVLAALLAVVRDLPAYVRRQDAGRWEDTGSGTLLGTRALVIGAGDLGTNVRDRLVPFGVDVLLAGRTARDGVLGPGDVAAVLPEVDVVVLVVPITAETRGLADAAFLGALRDGAILVNAGRGPLVDTDALLAELRAGRLRAALDVTDPEPLPDGHPLFSAPGLLLTPHVAGHVEGWKDRAWAVIRTQLEALAAGEQPPNLVHPG